MIIMGALWEVVAMIFRVLLTRHQNVSVYYTVSLLLMLLAPLCMPPCYPLVQLF